MRPVARRTCWISLGMTRTWQPPHSSSRTATSASPLRCRATFRNGSRYSGGMVAARARRSPSSPSCSRRSAALLGLLHFEQDALVVRRPLGLAGLDLVQHRLVFLVGLDLEELGLVLGDLGLDRHQLPLEAPAVLLHLLHGRAGLLEILLG